LRALREINFWLRFCRAVALVPAVAKFILKIPRRSWCSPRCRRTSIFPPLAFARARPEERMVLAPQAQVQNFKTDRPPGQNLLDKKFMF